MKDKLDKIQRFAEKHMSENKDSAHNIDHVMRVYQMALKLSEGEQVDLDVVKAAVLLHDIGGISEQNDHTGKTDHSLESAKLAKPFLENLGLNTDKVEHILACIISHRYRTDNKPASLEAKIVFDADKLDAIGAIGLARGFTWVGRNNAYIYREVNTQDYINENLGGQIDGRIQDKTKHSPQINWETKDKYIINKLYTEKAKEIAKSRVRFNETFQKRLKDEILGKV